MKKITKLAALLALIVAALFATVAVGPAADAAPPGRGAGGEKTTVVEWGPLDIPAAQDGMMGQFENVIVKDGGCSSIVGYFADCLDMNIEPPCRDCYITSIIPNLIDSDTREVINYDTGGMLHHVVNLDFSQPDPSCRPNWFGDSINQLGAAEGGNERFAAAGNERTVFDFPDGYGYYVPSDADWGFIADLMNMRPEARRYSFQYTFTWVRKGVAPVQPVWLDIDNCADSEVDLPAGYSDTEWDWESTVSGTVVGIGGHVHDQGIAIAAENVTKNETICTSRAGYATGGVGEPAGPGTGADAHHPADWWHQTSDANPYVPLASFKGHISGHEVCTMTGKTITGGTSYRRGDTIRLHTTYYHDADHGGHGDMGIMVMYVA